MKELNDYIQAGIKVRNYFKDNYMEKSKSIIMDAEIIDSRCSLWALYDNRGVVGAKGLILIAKEKDPSGKILNRTYPQTEQSQHFTSFCEKYTAVFVNMHDKFMINLGIAIRGCAY